MKLRILQTAGTVAIISVSKVFIFCIKLLYNYEKRYMN